MEDVGEAVQDAVTTATVGASFLNPLTMWNHTTGPIERWENADYKPVRAEVQYDRLRNKTCILRYDEVFFIFHRVEMDRDLVF